MRGFFRTRMAAMDAIDTQILTRELRYCAAVHRSLLQKRSSTSSCIISSCRTTMHRKWSEIARSLAASTHTRNATDPTQWQ